MIDSSHERFEELAAGFALDTLDLPDRRAFEEHVDSCPECTELLAGFLAAASTLAIGVPQREAPAGLRDRVMQAVRTGRDASPSPSLRSWLGSRSNPVRFGMAASVAAVFVASALLLTWVLDVREDAAIQRRLVARSYEALSVMAAAERRWEVVGTAASADVRGMVGYDEETGMTSIVVWGLDEDPAMQYNVWLRDDAQRTRVARLYAADGGFWAVIEEDVVAADGLGVTQVGAEGQRTDVIDAVLTANQPP